MVDPDLLPRPGPTKPLLWTSYPQGLETELLNLEARRSSELAAQAAQLDRVLAALSSLMENPNADGR